MQLKYQLFLALLVISALMIGLISAINSWNFGRGFLGYLNSVETRRLESLADALAVRYEPEGNWEWVNSNEKEVRILIDRHLRKARQPPPRREGNRRGEPRSDGGRESVFDSKRPPPPGAPTNQRRPIARDARLIVADAEKNPVFGNPRDSKRIQWLPIKVDTAIVGYVGSVPRTEVTEQIDQLFERQQKQGFVFAGLAMVLLSAVLAAPFASYIVKPLLRVNAVVSQISQGRYDRRVSMKRRDEIGDLARNINHLSGTLEKNLESRQRWIAEISHELRTPVSVLRGELEAIQDGVRELNPAAIESLHTDVIRLNRLIDDLHDLSLSDLGALNYQMQTLDFQSLVQDYLAADETVVDAADLKLDWQPDRHAAIIMGDRQRLEQLLRNLLQNSVRYTDKGGAVRVSVKNEEKHVHLSWEDSGPGVSPEQLPKLFDSLYRTDESRHRDPLGKSGGSGLGLTIVKKITEAHQGTVVASESELGGVHVRVSLPRLRSGAVV